MSIRVMAWYWDNSPQDGHKLLLLLALADWSDDNGECFPSIAGIANRIRRKPRTTQLTIGELEDAGEIMVYQGQGKGRDGQRSPLYYLLKYREAAGIVTPPMIIEAAKHYREQSRKQGKRGAKLRKTQSALLDESVGVQQITPPTGATDYTPTPATGCTPTPVVDCTPTGATRCTQIHHIDPSYRSVINDPPPPLDLGTNNGGGGGPAPHRTHSSNYHSNTNGHHSTHSGLPPQNADHLAMRTLALALIADNLPAWNNPAAHVATRDATDLHNLLAWLWLLDRIRQAETASPYSVEAYYDAGAVDEYRAAIHGVRDLAAFVISRTGGGASPQHQSPKLCDADAAALAAALCAIESEAT